MTRLYPIAWLVPLLAPLAFATTVPVVAQQSGPAMGLRTMLPRLEGETLSEKKVVLPDLVKGKIGFLVFSFSRGASGAASCWTGMFARIGTPDADATAFGIMMLADVPRLIRGLAVAGIKSGMPVELHDRIVKLFSDNDVWRARLGVKSADIPHVVLVDRTGQIRWLYAGACDASGDQRLREQLKELLAEK